MWTARRAQAIVTTLALSLTACSGSEPAEDASTTTTPSPVADGVDAPLRDPQIKRIVILGDSLATEPNAWPSKIDCLPVLNLSFPGASLHRETIIRPMTQRIGELSLFFEPTDLVIVALGTNDVRVYTDADSWLATEMPDNYRTVRDAIAKTGASQRWATMPPLSRLWPYEDAYDRAVASRFQWNDFLLTQTEEPIDLAEPLGDILDEREDFGDHVHLSRFAQDAVTKKALSVLCPDS